MPNLSDTQAILLVHAAQHQDGSLYPLPKSGAEGAALEKAIAALLKQGLLEERETKDKTATHRTDGDLRFGLFIASCGLAALNITPDDDGSGTEPAPARAPSPPRSFKSDLVKSLLEQPDGASLPQLIEATGWLPHTTRAALTGLRKKGLSIERFSRDGTTCYRSVGAA